MIVLSLVDLIYFAAAAWYLAYAVTQTHGPFGVFEWVRNHAGLGGLTSCIICLVVWFALLFRLVGHNIIIDALAIAGVALWLHGLTSWRANF